MKNSLYFIAFILILVWGVAFFGYNSEGIVHVMLLIALIAILLQIIQNKRRIKS